MSEELQAQREARSNQLEAQNSQLESRLSQLEAQNSQLQDSLTEYVESASSMSQATKKQKIVTWADILCPLQIAMPKKIDCILSPNNFHKLPLENKKLTLEVIGLEDQFDAINAEVARSLGQPMSFVVSPFKATKTFGVNKASTSNLDWYRPHLKLSSSDFVILLLFASIFV